VVNAAGPIGRDPAQRLARRELSKAIYHDHSPLHAVLSAIARFLDRIFRGANTAIPGGWWTLVALAALVVIVIATILVRIGPVGRTARSGPLLGTGTTPLTARQHRELSESAAARADYAQAIIERVRAIATGLEERGVLRPDAGRTADEMAAQAATRFPDHAPALAGAARDFDRVCYGEGTGSQAEYERVRSLDETLAQARILAVSPS
jgi:hypothetical protein